MLHRVRLKKASTLGDLFDRVAVATSELGRDALWTGHKDGCVYVWKKDRFVSLAIEPKAQYDYEIDEVEVVS